MAYLKAHEVFIGRPLRDGNPLCATSSDGNFSTISLQIEIANEQVLPQGLREFLGALVNVMHQQSTALRPSTTYVKCSPLPFLMLRLAQQGTQLIKRTLIPQGTTVPHERHGFDRSTVDFLSASTRGKGH